MGTAYRESGIAGNSERGAADEETCHGCDNSASEQDCQDPREIIGQGAGVLVKTWSIGKVGDFMIVSSVTRPTQMKTASEWELCRCRRLHPVTCWTRTNVDSTWPLAHRVETSVSVDIDRRSVPSFQASTREYSKRSQIRDRQNGRQTIRHHSCFNSRQYGDGQG